MTLCGENMRGRVFTRGEMVTVRAYGGRSLTRRVWADSNRGVTLCSESDYQRSLTTGEEPRYVGFPKEDILRFDD